MELSIDTSTEIAGIALSEKGELLSELSWQSRQNHTVQLVPNINSILKLNKTEIGAIKAIFVAKGPGSFNGLRVGVSAAKGFAFALNVPLVAVSTLEVEAYPFAFSGLPICPIHGAGRGEIAAATYIFEDKWRCIEEHFLTTAESLTQKTKMKTVFCGEIPDAVMEHLISQLGSLAIIPETTARLRRPGYLAKLGWDILAGGHKDDPSTLQPVYLRQPPITLRVPKTLKI